VVEVARGGLATLDRPRDTDPSVSRLPPRILAAIGTRLDLLSEEATEALEIAATIGRAFTFEVLEQASELEEAALVRALDELWQRQIVREQGLNSYDFGHDRIRDAAYARIGPRRRRLLHRRVAQALELLRATDLDTVSGQIAAHYDGAGLASKAIEWFERAAGVADRVSANVEEVRYLTRAVELIAQLPPSLERDRNELRLQLSLGSPTVAIRGYATGEFAVALDRARVLAATVLDRRSEVLALNALTAAQIVHGEVRRSLETGRASVALVEAYPELVTACEMSYAGSMNALGMQDEAVDHFERAVAAYLPGRSTMAIGFDPGAFAMSWESHALWLSGAPGRAVARHMEAMEVAATCGPHSLALANAYGALLYFFMRDDDAMVARARSAMELCERYGFAYYGQWGEILLAWRDRNDPGSNGPARIEAALESLRSIGAEYRRPLYLAILAETHQATGDIDRASSIFAAALVTALANEDVYWLPEIQRSIAELGPVADREATLRTALALARSQGSRSLALRAAASLARDTGVSDELRAVIEDLPAGEPSAEVIAATGLLERSAAV
jgi:tetratricopeptide (TPR) repeat protein